MSGFLLAFFFVGGFGLCFFVRNHNYSCFRDQVNGEQSSQQTVQNGHLGQNGQNGTKGQNGQVQDPSEFQLWVKTKLDESPYPLIGE